MVSDGTSIPTHGRLLSGAWQAVRGVLFEGTAPTGRPNTVTLSLLSRTASLSVLERVATLAVTHRTATLEVIE